ncbi:TSUP family transporter [Alkalicoccobacillus murimartini]|uniref:Probable membrane transporter protein n=1 Tax=Alkalicoccobacillus murimartini TaxID=171685 RepID=A0ABT9YM56_9BACI|nr:TSUP family transporter [Alkalicoccobacillus murimartini]MDQ0208678.1 putative membrane protein YfcA [Alkalicoccobacillus murimartini]
MNLDIDMVLLIITIGFLAAFIDAVVGGGGLITIPALLFAGLNPTAAVATNKLAGTMGSLTSTFMFYRSGHLELKSVLKFFPLSLIGSLLGAWTVYIIDPALFKPVMLFMLIVVAIYTIVKKDWGKGVSTFKELTKKRWILFAVTLTTIGFYDGFLGPGTGSFFMFAFLFIGYNFLQAAGNAKFLNFGSNISALILFMILGQVNYTIGLLMGVSGIAGSIVGAHFAIRYGSGFVRILFIVVTSVLIIKNVYDYVIELMA